MTEEIPEIPEISKETGSRLGTYLYETSETRCNESSRSLVSSTEGVVPKFPGQLERSTSFKHKKFTSEMMGDKRVTELPGIGPTCGDRLTLQGFDKACTVLDQFLLLKRQKRLFLDWLKQTANVRRDHGERCFNYLNEWCDHHLGPTEAITSPLGSETTLWEREPVYAHRSLPDRRTSQSGRSEYVLSGFNQSTYARHDFAVGHLSVNDPGQPFGRYVTNKDDRSPKLLPSRYSVATSIHPTAFGRQQYLFDAKSGKSASSNKSRVYSSGDLLTAYTQYNQQLLIGAAGTGKTLLIQTKCFDLLELGERVFILAPHFVLKSYKSAFEQNGDCGNYLLLDWTTVSQKIISITEKYGYIIPALDKENEDEITSFFDHYQCAIRLNDDFYKALGEIFEEYIFIDSMEFSRNSLVCVLVILAMTARDKFFCWIALDPYQCSHKIDAAKEDAPWKIVVKIAENVGLSKTVLNRVIESSTDMFNAIYSNMDWNSVGLHPVLGTEISCFQPQIVEVQVLNFDDAITEMKRVLRDEIYFGLLKAKERSIGVLLSGNFENEAKLVATCLKKAYAHMSVRILSDESDFETKTDVSSIGTSVTREPGFEGVSILRTYDSVGLDWAVVIHLICMPSDSCYQERQQLQYLARSRATTCLMETLFTYASTTSMKTVAGTGSSDKESKDLTKQIKLLSLMSKTESSTDQKKQSGEIEIDLSLQQRVEYSSSDNSKGIMELPMKSFAKDPSDILVNDYYHNCSSPKGKALMITNNGGTLVDFMNMNNLFNQLEYDSTIQSTWSDSMATIDDVKLAVKKFVSQFDEDRCDSCIVYFSTNAANGQFIGRDKKAIRKTEFYGLITECQKLQSKAKIFFIQTYEDCQDESKKEAFADQEVKEEENFTKNAKDTFILHLKTPTNFQEENGSCFVQSICEIISKYAHEPWADLMTLMTLINKKMREIYEERGQRLSMDVTTLGVGKSFHFFPGQPCCRCRKV